MKKKGFTLIELLAVIVILAVIALIATPLIMNVINDAKKNSFKDSAYGITKAVELKAMREGLTSDSPSTFVVDLTGTDLEYNGSKPKAGYAAINVSGDIALEMNDGTWCIKKGFTDVEVTITKLEDGCDGSSIQTLDLSTPTSNNSGNQGTNIEQVEEWCLVGTIGGENVNSCDVGESVSTETECQAFLQQVIDRGDIQEGDLTCQKESYTLRSEKELSTLNPNAYFKHTYKDDNPYASYVCFMQDQEYCLRGKDDSGDHYYENVNVLESLQPWFESNGGYCFITFKGTVSRCALYSENTEELLFEMNASDNKVYIYQADPSSCDSIVVEEGKICVSTNEALEIDTDGTHKNLIPAHEMFPDV